MMHIIHIQVDYSQSQMHTSFSPDHIKVFELCFLWRTWKWLYVAYDERRASQSHSVKPLGLGH